MSFNSIRTSLQKLIGQFVEKKPSKKTKSVSTGAFHVSPASQPKSSSTVRTTRHAPASTSLSENERRFYVSPTGTVGLSDAFLRSDCAPHLPNASQFDAFIELGIDFGTKYTKVCFRDENSEHTEIVTFTSEKSSIEQALILSKVEVSDQNELFAGFTKGEWKKGEHFDGKAIDLLKMRLAYLDRPPSEGDWLPPIEGFETEEAIEHLCAYFLSSVIVRTQNWLRSQHPILFKGRSVGWVLNIGAPIAYWEGPAISRFNHVLKMAWALSYTPAMTKPLSGSIARSSCLTLEQLGCCTNYIRQWMAQNPEHPFDGYVKPEIAAAVWSYIQAAVSSEGFYIFFDIGDGTAEGAAFRYYKKLGEAKIDFYSGSVEPLGVSALSRKLEAEIQMSEDAVRNYLVDSKSPIQSSRISHSQTRKSFQLLIASTVVDGCEKHEQIRRYQASDDIGADLKIFLGGGGANIPFYRATVQATHGEFNHDSIDLPPYRLSAVPRPRDLEMNQLNPDLFNRFAIAYGLSMPEGDSPTFDFPNPTDSGAVTTTATRPIHYEDSKDAC